jgi:toxin ParE1/3/4
MARFRLSRVARADLIRILTSSRERWGAEGRQRYEALIARAMRQGAEDPEGRLTRRRDDLQHGIRSFHLRHATADNLKFKVRKPAHVLYYRAVAPDLVEIVRVLHEHMEPSRHIGEAREE